MIPDSRVREVLDAMTSNNVLSYSFETSFRGPVHKVYKVGLREDEPSMSVNLLLATGSRLVSTKEGYIGYNEEDGLTTQQSTKKCKKYIDEHPPSPFHITYPSHKGRFLTDVKRSRLVTGPLVDHLRDTNLETGTALKMIVCYDGIDLNEDYLNAPWWRNVIGKIASENHVETQNPREGIPECESNDRRGGLLLPKYMHRNMKQKLVFRAEATDSTEVDKTIRGVWYSGQTIQRIIDAEERRLYGQF